MTDRPEEAPRSRRGRPRDPAVDAAVLDAAADLLAEVGFARLTMEQVASRAGVAKASLYLRWPNKMALVADAIEQRSGVVPEIPDSGSLPDDMRGFLRALLRGQQRGPQALAAVVGEIASNPELAQAWRRGMTGTLVGCLRVIVTRAIDRGELPATSDVELLSLMPLAVMQNWRLVYDRPPGEELIDHLVGQFYAPGASA